MIKLLGCKKRLAFFILFLIILTGLSVLFTGCSSDNKKIKNVSATDFSARVREQIEACENLSKEGVFSIEVSKRDKCITKLAISERNLDICYMIDSTIIKDDIGKKDSMINYCFGNYAYKLKDIKGCDAMIGDYSSQCYSMFKKK